MNVDELLATPIFTPIRITAEARQEAIEAARERVEAVAAEIAKEHPDATLYVHYIGGPITVDCAPAHTFKPVDGDVLSITREVARGA